MPLIDRLNVTERLMKNTMIIDGHWLWIGGLDRKGYGKGWFNGKTIQVHRISAHLHHGLDLGDFYQQALHKNTCRHRNCWNPDCIYVGSSKDNHRDRVELKTHCPKGHEYNAENTSLVVEKEGNIYRRCKTCSRETTRRLTQERKSI